MIDPANAGGTEQIFLCKRDMWILPSKLSFIYPHLTFSGGEMNISEILQLEPFLWLGKNSDMLLASLGNSPTLEGIHMEFTIILECFYWNLMTTYSLKPPLIFNNNKSSLSLIHIACYQSQRTVMWSNLILIKIHSNLITYILQMRIIKPGEGIIFLLGHICYSSMSQNVNSKYDSHYPTKLDTLDTLPRGWGDNLVNYYYSVSCLLLNHENLNSDPHQLFIKWTTVVCTSGSRMGDSAQRRTPRVCWPARQSKNSRFTETLFQN